ncbi:MAG: hypothetical protein LKK27_03685 [Eubacterium sp.]|jgi:hypothetical protein|nr:hypothetical protein [Eubacterium sp.]
MRKRLENIWYYHKWKIIVGLLILICLLNYVTQLVKKQEPVLSIAIVTGKIISQKELDQLQTAVENAEDEERVPITVNYYYYDGLPMEAEDTAKFSASGVQLAADLQTKESQIYITDNPAMLMKADTTLYSMGGSAIVFNRLSSNNFTVLVRNEISKKFFLRLENHMRDYK